jgi:Transposase DDE domain
VRPIPLTSSAYVSADASAVAAARPPVAQAAERVVGQQYVKLLQDHLARLRKLYDHPNRVLHYDSVLAALLIGFYNTTLRSLRTLEDQSQSEGLVQDLPMDRVCRSTLSDAMKQMKACDLQPIVASLLKQAPALRRQDNDLHALLKSIIALDGSVFTVPADVLWAIALTRRGGQAGRQVRLNMALDVLNFLPADFSVSGSAEGSESASFIKHLVEDVVYVCDRNFVDFTFLHAVFDKHSDVVVRLKSDTRFVVQEERPLSEQDRAAGVISDRIGHVPGSAGSPGFGDKLLREVVLWDARKGKPVRLLSSLLEVPARIIGLIYRYRWMIELFFKWLKCTARVRHLMSENLNGITMQLYVAVIGVLLTYLRTGRRPSVYAANVLSLVASGQMNLETALKIIEFRHRERELERQRLARKKQQTQAEKIGR